MGAKSWVGRNVLRRQAGAGESQNRRRSRRTRVRSQSSDWTRNSSSRFATKVLAMSEEFIWFYGG